jgi:hypothetical protein
MEPNKVKELLEKYYDGLTSLEEDMFLQDYFCQHEVPKELLVDKELFLYRSSAGLTTALMNSGIEQKLSSLVAKLEKGEKENRKIDWWYKAGGIAAAVAFLVLSCLFYFKPTKEPVLKDTYKNPQLAYNEARRALLFVSQQLNRGTKPLSQMDIINDSMDELSSFSSFGESLESLELISKYYDEKKVITHKKNR